MLAPDLSSNIDAGVFKKRRVKKSSRQRTSAGHFGTPWRKAWNKVFGTTASEADRKRRKVRYTFRSQLRATTTNSWVNVLFAFVIAGFLVKYTGQSAVTVFAVNFIAIIPSSSQLAVAVDELSLCTGEIIGALLSASFR